MGDMTTISTCGKCGLHYRESLIPHECAEWTKGRKQVAKDESMRDQTAEDEANEREIRRIRRARLGKSGIQFQKTLNEFRERYDIEEQPMSDTLQEQEDMPILDHDASEECSESGCPCHEWIKRTSQHEPAARGGGDEWMARTDYKGCWEIIAKDADGTIRTIVNRLGFYEPEEQNARQIVTEHNQHQSLVAERELLVKALRAAHYELLTMLPRVTPQFKQNLQATVDFAKETLDEIEKRGAR